MELKVSSKSNPNSVAGAITGLVKENEKIEIQAIGAGAVNQGIKSIIIANGFLAPLGKHITIEPCFYQTTLDENEVSGIKLKLIVEE